MPVFEVEQMVFSRLNQAEVKVYKAVREQAGRTVGAEFRRERSHRNRTVDKHLVLLVGCAS